MTHNLECIGKTIPVQTRTGPEGSRSLMLPDFQDVRYIARLSTLCTGRLYPPGRTPGIHFCSKLSRTQCHSVGWRIISIEHATSPLVAQCLNQQCHRVTYSRVGTSNVLYTQRVVIQKVLCLQFRNVLLVTVLKFVCFGWWESQNCYWLGPTVTQEAADKNNK